MLEYWYIERGLLTIENTDSDLKVHALHYANELLVHIKLLQTRQTRRNNKKQSKREFWLWLSIVWETHKLTRYQSEEISYKNKRKS